MKIFFLVKEHNSEWYLKDTVMGAPGTPPIFTSSIYDAMKIDTYQGAETVINDIILNNPQSGSIYKIIKLYSSRF